MTDEKQIEEMAKVIDDRLIEANGYLGSMNRGEGYWIAQKLVEHYQPKLPENVVVTTREMYDELYKKANLYEYQKENAVVLTKEEYTALINEFNALQHKYDDICDRYRLCKDENKTIKQHAVMVRKETAREIIEKARYLIEERNGMDGYDLEDVSVDGVIVVEVLDELAKEHGVDVE